MAISTQDFIKGIDLTGVGATATASQLNQLIDAGYVGADRGMVVVSTDHALNQPFVPDAITTAKFTRYFWKRIPHADADDLTPIYYMWDDSVTSGDLLKWVIVNYGNAIQALDNGVSVKAFDLIVKGTQVDPRYFGADPTGVEDSTAAIRKAIFYADSIGGSVKFKPGTYLVSYNVDYQSDETKPYGSGTLFCDRDRANVWIPVPSGMTICADGDAIIKIARMEVGQYGSHLFSSKGFENTTFEGLCFDGNYEDQPSVVGGYAGGATVDGIVCGNNSIVRNCKFTRMGGYAVPTTGMADGYPQVSLIGGEYFCIVAASNCLIEHNYMSNCWAGAVIVVGSYTKVIGNYCQDMAGIVLSCFFPYIGSIYELCNTNPSFILDYRTNSPLSKWKGIDLGTYPSIAQDFFGYNGSNPLTSAQLEAKSTFIPPATGAQNDYDKSCYSYWCIGNEFVNNTIIRFALDAIHLERGLGTIIKGNHITQGIARLLNPSDANYPVSGGSILTSTSGVAIECSQLSSDSIIEDNTIVCVDQGTVVLSGGVMGKFAVLEAVADTEAILNTYYGAGNSQLGIQDVTIGKNKVYGLYNAFSKIHLQDTVLYGRGQTFGINSIGGVGSINAGDVPSVVWPNAVQEVIFKGGACDDIAMDPNIFLLPLGKFNFCNTQGVNSMEKDRFYLTYGAAYGHYDASGVIWGTLRTNFRFIPLRSLTRFQLTYKIRITDTTDSTFVVEQSGVINVANELLDISFAHDITSLNYQNGSIEIVPFHNNLLPGNMCAPCRRVLDSHYRGGLAFYCNPADYTKYGIVEGGPGYLQYLSNTLIIQFVGEMIEL